MASVNKAVLIGFLGQDPTVRYLPNSTAVTTFSIATDHKKKDEEKSETTWHRVVCFGRTGESIAKVAKKGAQVYAEGRMTVREYQDKSGHTQRANEIMADRVLLLSGGHEETGTVPEHVKQIAQKNTQHSFDDDDSTS